MAFKSFRSRVKRTVKRGLRSVKKRYFKGKGFSRPKVSTMARDVMNLKAMVNAEKEVFAAQTLSTQFSPTAPLVSTLTNTTEGSGHGQRDGESIKLHGFRWNLRFSQQTAAAGPQYIRAWLVKYIGPRGTTPALTNFLKPDFDGNLSYHSERNEDWFTSWEVISTVNAKIQADTVSGIQMYTVRKKYGRFRGKTHQRYGGPAQTDLLTDQMYTIYVCSNGTIGTSSACTVDSQILVSFYDN